ncbi:hypothetical protein COLU111180_09395 [Cohnella lubricantis]
MDSLGLEADMDVHGMSRGQEAHLMLALCLARDVPLLVLDEPFSGIDMLSRERIVSALIDALNGRRGQEAIGSIRSGKIGRGECTCKPP